MFYELICYDHFRFVFFFEEYKLRYTRTFRYDGQYIALTLANVLTKSPASLVTLFMRLYAVCTLFRGVITVHWITFIFILNKPSYITAEQHKIIQKPIIDDLIYLR